ncbi:MAG TPA: hypothetical protein VK966_01270, partial [Longimicrobiales bacterium]|nr:hypothetical protein [Longimicrobiales bacterium]
LARKWTRLDDFLTDDDLSDYMTDAEFSTWLGSGGDGRLLVGQVGAEAAWLTPAAAGIATESWVDTNYQPAGSYAPLSHSHGYVDLPISAAQVSDWEEAHDWGDHAEAGYAQLPNHPGSDGEYLLRYLRNGGTLTPTWVEDDYLTEADLSDFVTDAELDLRLTSGEGRFLIGRTGDVAEWRTLTSSDLPSHTHAASQITPGTFGGEGWVIGSGGADALTLREDGEAWLTFGREVTGGTVAGRIRVNDGGTPVPRLTFTAEWMQAHRPLGIGTSPGSGFALDVSGAARFTSAEEASSRRWKSDIAPYAWDADRFDALDFVRYTDRDGKPGAGLIAEGVLPLYPDAVTLDDDGLPDSLRYGHIWTQAAAGVQDHERRIRELEARIRELEAA